MNKIYITDLDHTFLRSDLSISDFTKQTWNEKSRHAYLSIATARSFYSASTLLEGFHINAPMILLDGSLVVSADKKIIDAKFLDKETANTMIDEAVKLFNMHPFVIGLNGTELNETFDFPVQLTQVQKQLLMNYKDDPRLMQYKKVYASHQCFKIVYMGSQEEMFPLSEYLQMHFGGFFEFKLSPENYTKGYFLTILHPFGDKAHGLQRLSDHLQRPLEDITVFGDSINDIGMFKLAGTSVAVSNALEQTKAVADIILEHSNDDDGVAHYLNNAVCS